MSESAERAVGYHAEGCNCCQSVLLALRAEHFSHDDAMRMGACFGGGMSKGEVCGAATAALMILGFREGSVEAADKEGKKRARAAAGAYLTSFQERFGSYLCKELIKSNGRKICDEAIKGAVELLEG